MPRPQIDKDPRFLEAVNLLKNADQLIQDALKPGMSLGHVRRLLMMRAGWIDPRRQPRKSILQRHAEFSTSEDTREPIELTYGEDLEYDYNSRDKTISHISRGTQILSHRQDQVMYAFASSPETLLDIPTIREVGGWPEFVTEDNIKTFIMELRRIADEKQPLPNGKFKHNSWRHIRSVRRLKTFGYIFMPNGFVDVN